MSHIISNTQIEGYGEETLKDCNKKDYITIYTEPPNKIEAQNDVKCSNKKCIRAATTKCGKCESIICDVHVAIFSKQYKVLCKQCQNERISASYDRENKCINQCQRIVCSKCMAVVALVLVCLVLFVLYTHHGHF
eukprot:117476_1